MRDVWQGRPAARARGRRETRETLVGGGILIKFHLHHQRRQKTYVRRRPPAPLPPLRAGAMVKNPSHYSSPATKVSLLRPIAIDRSVRLGHEPVHGEVPRRPRERQTQAVDLFRGDDLAPQPRRLRQPEREVEHVVLVVVRLRQRVVDLLVLDDHVTRRAREGALSMGRGGVQRRQKRSRKASRCVGIESEDWAERHAEKSP